MNHRMTVGPFGTHPNQRISTSLILLDLCRLKKPKTFFVSLVVVAVTSSTHSLNPILANSLSKQLVFLSQFLHRSPSGANQ